MYKLPFVPQEFRHAGKGPATTVRITNKRSFTLEKKKLHHVIINTSYYKDRSWIQMTLHSLAHYLYDFSGEFSGDRLCHTVCCNQERNRKRAPVLWSGLGYGKTEHSPWWRSSHSLNKENTNLLTGVAKIIEDSYTSHHPGHCWHWRRWGKKWFRSTSAKLLPVASGFAVAKVGLAKGSQQAHESNLF